MNKSIRLGKILGINFGVHYSWFLIFAFITILLSLDYTDSYRDWSTLTHWTVGLITSLLFFASVVAHELAHSMVAMRYGIPVKSITLFVFGGVARISKEATRPSIEFKMAIAGPLCSLAIAAFFGIIWLLTRGFIEPIAAMAGYLSFINVMLAAFNLIPGFPLDGGRVLRSIIWWTTGNYFRASRIAYFGGRVVSYTFIVGGIISTVFIFWLSGQPWVGGLWFALIGWFLHTATGASYRQVKLHQALAGLRVGDVVIRDCPIISREIPLNKLAGDYFLHAGRRYFLVGGEGRFEGIINLDDLRKVPRDRWEVTTVGQVMTSVEQLGTIQSDVDITTVLDQMVERGISQMPVVYEGRVIGVISQDELMNLAQIRSELKM